MRLAFSAAFLAALAFAVPAHAAGLSGIGADLFGNYFHFPNKSNIAKPPVRGISAGPLHMQLQHTKLEQIRKLFGGTIRTQGSEKTLANWLCYHTDGSGKAPAANTWFISNILGGGEFVMIVAEQAASPGQIPGDCDPAPKTFQLPNLGIPGLGASSADLQAAFGMASMGGAIAYRADAPGADALGTANNAQYIGYLMSGGRVAAFGAGETSVPVAPKSD
ncbi:MAG: hypothetical protein ACTHNL_07045 [Devosia sp.]|jgi:hypothetical protein